MLSVGEDVVVVAAAAAAAAVMARLTLQIVGELGTLPQKPSKKGLAFNTFGCFDCRGGKANCVRFTKNSKPIAGKVSWVWAPCHVDERRLIFTHCRNTVYE
jgi:hypothetical protein